MSDQEKEVKKMKDLIEAQLKRFNYNWSKLAERYNLSRQSLSYIVKSAKRVDTKSIAKLVQDIENDPSHIKIEK